MTEPHIDFDGIRHKIWLDVSSLPETEQISFFLALASWAQTEAEMIGFHDAPFANSNG